MRAPAVENGAAGGCKRRVWLQVISDGRQWSKVKSVVATGAAYELHRMQAGLARQDGLSC